MRIYNLFPLLAGPMTRWDSHFDRIADLGFDWVFVNPVQRSGVSKSLYSIADYFAIDPRFLDGSSSLPPDDQVRRMIAAAEARGLRVMVDLVVNHCAADAALVREHPEWFVWEDGHLAHPGCDDHGRRIVWRDLAQFRHRGPAAGDIEAYADRVIEHLAGLGFKGFRCDAAYQIPLDAWRRCIERARARHPGVIFAAETLGCPADLTRECARCGFDWVFNSSKWWDFHSPWLMEQYDLIRETCRSIGFPESHDTPRLWEESGGNLAAVKQRYLFAALFSAGVMMPVGYEFGFRKRLHVVETRPEDWEAPSADLTGFIRAANGVKRSHPVFNEECPTHLLPGRHPDVLVMWKGALHSREEALIVLNTNVHEYRRFEETALGRLVQSGAPLACVSPENPLPFVPEPFVYDLRPGEAIVLVAAR